MLGYWSQLLWRGAGDKHLRRAFHQLIATCLNEPFVVSLYLLSKKKITPLKKTNYINCYLFSWQSQEMRQLPAASYNQNSAAALLMIWHQLICCAAFMKDGRDIAKSRSFFLSIGVSIGMKERALFLPDISLTARGYLSVLIRAVAGPVWLLPGCESNHTSSSPLSLIYGGKKTARHGRGSLKGLRQEKMQLKKKEHISHLLPYRFYLQIHRARWNISESRLGSHDRLFVFPFLKFHGGKKTCCLRVCNINNHDL